LFEIAIFERHFTQKPGGKKVPGKMNFFQTIVRTCKKRYGWAANMRNLGVMMVKNKKTLNDIEIVQGKCK